MNRLQPTRGWTAIRLSELWEYRELLYFFVWRDIKVRYSQTALGATWAIIQPFMTMVVFSIFFGHLAKMPSEGIPYPIFSYAALVPWTFFANGLAQASNSLTVNANLIRKIYFPRLLVPLAGVLSGTLDFGVALTVLGGMMLYYGRGVTPDVFWLLPLLLLAFVTSLGTGLWLSAVQMQFRDVRHITSFVVQLWLFATPVAYPSSLLPEPWRTLFGLNPMVGVVEGFRWALLRTGPPPNGVVFISALVALCMLTSGVVYFQHRERTFADLV